jgi:RNA exonuclease 1
VALLRLVSADAILVGHSLDSDLRALRLYHRRCVDTAISYPHPRGYPLRLKLRKLAEDYLQQRIQTSGSDGKRLSCLLGPTCL